MLFVRSLPVRIACGALAVLGVVPIASAQSTLTLTQPDTQAWYATVRGGTYANKNLSTILETRSSTNPEYLRRALLKFDTHTTIPAGTSVASAVMTVTVKQGSPDATRRIGVYQVTRSWQDTEVTFRYRRTGIKWGVAGGDLGTKLTEKNVSNAAGTRVSFDITPIVQQAVKGQLGSSRYTRVALVDLDESTRNSWRAYHTSSASNAAVRPTLKVTYSSSSTSSTSTQSTEPDSGSGATLTLQQPKSQAWYATIRGGSYANTNLPTILETRAADHVEYRRRALLKFDTENTIAAGTPIASAVLTVTVKQASGDPNRRIQLYQNTTTWDDARVTWKQRKTGIGWGTAGGDLGTKLAEKVVGNAPGMKVSFDVTPLVQQAVAGKLGSSRYTRVVLLDAGSSTNESWRAYHTPDDPNVALRPTLKVTYGSGSTSSTTSSTSTSITSPTTTSTMSGGKILRIVHYNISKNGWGTDGKYDPNRVANWVVTMNPDIISFNELEKWNSYSLGEDGVALYKSLLEAKTGAKWYVWDAQDYGDWTGKGLHNAVFSKIPFSATYRHIYSAGKLKTVGGVTINFNGRNINFMTTHFDPYNADYRLTQAKDLVSYMNGFAQNRIVAGDFNDQSGDSPITTMTNGYYDAWAEGKKAGIAYAAADNPYGNTRNSRIDYIFYSHQEQHLTLKKIQVVDTRDAYGKMPSDHRPVLAEFLVQ